MKNGIYILLGLMILLASCEKGGVTNELKGQQIYLTASVSDLQLTKVPFEGTVPTTSNPLNVDVWASTVSSVFLDKNKTGRLEDDRVVSIHTGGHFQSGEPQLLSQAIYPAPSTSGGQGAPVYFVAMHPQSKDGSKWTTKDGTQADFSFRGCEDVMFAKQVSGAYDTNEQDQQVINSPTLQFEHLLTLITVKMGFELEDGVNSDDVKEAWGNVIGLQIQLYDRSQKEGYIVNSVSIDLSDGEGFNYDGNVEYSGRYLGKMNFYASQTDDLFPSDSDGFQLSERIETAAYVMCAPVVATADSHEYIITVETANRGEQEVILDLKNALGGKYEGSSRGKHFGVTLKFKKGRAIAAQAIVESWENGGYGSGIFDE